MKKFLIILALLFLFAKPVITLAEEVIPKGEAQIENTVLLSEEESETYALEFTAEEKSILLDSIQTIRAILVFIVVVIVFCALFTFVGWFF